MTFGANYFCAFVFVFTLSIGESLYSPCVYTYTMNTADKGREGTYMALGNLPTFTATLVSGIMSGYVRTCNVDILYSIIENGLTALRSVY